jgi:hypothetical protein
MSRVISTDVPNELADRIEEEQEDDESRSAAVRRLLRAGLDGECDGICFTTPAALTLPGWFLVAAAFADVTTTAGYLGLALVLLGVVYQTATRRDLL